MGGVGLLFGTKVLRVLAITCMVVAASSKLILKNQYALCFGKEYFLPNQTFQHSDSDSIFLLLASISFFHVI